jgi:hypothetical protein
MKPRVILAVQALLVVGLLSACLHAQSVGIGTATPHSSARLHISDNARGLLIPNVALDSTDDVTTVSGPATSLLVYNTATAGPGAKAVSPGFYYWDGSQWVRLADGGKAWLLTGNAGTDPAVNFLGTLDNNSLRIRVDNQQTFQFNTNFSIQRDAGGNARGSDAVDLQRVRSAATQVASGNYSVIGGGQNNTASGPSATVGGGNQNTASGGSATVGGGYQNTASGNGAATVGGGWNNTASGVSATVGGGRSNTASGLYATVGGGQNNTASGFFATVGGGLQDTASGPYATVGGGWNNRARDSAATVSGGRDNIASLKYATVGGGWGNIASDTSATVGGGYINTANGWEATVGGGHANTASSLHGTIGGGGFNTVTASGINGTIGGGEYNTLSGWSATIAGGHSNNASNWYATIGGGRENTASGWSATIGGGYSNTASGGYSVVPGGLSNTANANYNLVFGQDVDPSVTETHRVYFFSPTNSGFLVINRLDGDHPIHVGTTNGGNGNGAYLTAGGQWTDGSSRSFKERFVRYRPAEVLEKILQLPVEGYFYKGTEEYHITPMAEDFYRLFGTGVHEIIETDSTGQLVRRPNPDVDKYLAASDVAGVALLGIQALHAENAQLRQRVSDLETENAALRARLERLETFMQRIASTQTNP